MKHAGEDTLNSLAALLEKLRSIDGLKERKRGTFYLRGAAFLHFHEDPLGVFADLKVDESWSRLKATSEDEQALLLTAARKEAMRRTRSG